MPANPHLILVNPRAGGGRALATAAALEPLYRAAGLSFEVQQTNAPRDALQRARAAARRFDVVVSVGGDGTMHEVANGLAEAAAAEGGPDKIAALAVVPVGTGNDFVKTLGVPTALAGAFDVLRGGLRRRIDLGRAGPVLLPEATGSGPVHEWFANDFSAGFGALVARDMSVPGGLLHAVPGKLAYFLVGLRRGLSAPQRMTLRLDGAERQGDFYEVHVGNGRYCGGGAQFTPRAELDDAVLDVTLLHTVPRLRNFLTMLVHLQRGSLAPARGVEFGRHRRVELAQGSSFPIYCDGEYRQVPLDPATGSARLTVEVVPAALDVMAPSARPALRA